MAAPEPSSPVDSALSLTMAVVASSPGPLLLLDDDFRIVAASASFCELFDVDPGAVAGRPLVGLGDGEWDLPQLQALLVAAMTATAPVAAQDIEFPRPRHPTLCLVVHAERLVYLDLEHHRLLLAITDVTEARADAKAKGAALRQNLVLLQEVRHRVANSLQIIASVLWQTARKTTSDETRVHLRDAHNRVMSVAALERLLSSTGEFDVELREYLGELCQNISTSMIGDSEQIRLVLTGAGGMVNARTSVSLGLIVTELVINALKHAFPDGRKGVITVDCALRGPNWALSVHDDGIGMSGDAADHTGQGTSIVEALAKQLGAQVLIQPGGPGTHIFVTRTTIALLEPGDSGGQGPAAEQSTDQQARTSS